MSNIYVPTLIPSCCENYSIYASKSPTILAAYYLVHFTVQAAPALRAIDYRTFSTADDAETIELVHHLLDSSQLQDACPAPFDEGLLFRNADSAEIKKQLQVSA